MWTWISSLFSGRRTPPPRSPWHGRAILHLEQLDERIVPAAPTTLWKNTIGDGLWSTAGNWDHGLPDANKIAVLQPVGGVSGTIVFDNTVPDFSRVAAGLTTANGFTGTLSMTGGKSLTVSSLPADRTTGFQWLTQANISQATANDVLIVTGGGTAVNNQWSGGTIGSTTVQSYLYINGGTTLQITGTASALGDNIIIGEDTNGGSTLEFYNQTATLNVNNNAYIKVSDNTNDLTPANQILFDTDVTQPGTVTKGLDTASADSFIDNYGIITRSNAGTYQINLPIKNEAARDQSNGKLDVQSKLWVSGQSLNKTANVSVYQVGGTTLLENDTQLRVAKGFLMTAGQLLTYGSVASIVVDDSNTQVSVTGGTIDISADNHALYGTLSVSGSGMSWTGGTFKAYVNAGMSFQQTQLAVGAGLTLGNGAHLQVTALGALAANFNWNPVTAGGTWNAPGKVDTGLTVIPVARTRRG